MLTIERKSPKRSEIDHVRHNVCVCLVAKGPLTCEDIGKDVDVEVIIRYSLDGVNDRDIPIDDFESHVGTLPDGEVKTYLASFVPRLDEFKAKALECKAWG